MPKPNLTFDQINKLIKSSRLNESFLLLKKEMANFPSLKNELEKLKSKEDTYRYMLDYIADGYNDPSYEDMMIQIKDTLYRANDLLLRELLLTDSSDLYSSTRRMFILRKTDFKSLLDAWEDSYNTDIKDLPDPSMPALSPLQYKCISNIFNYIWTKAAWDKEELDLLISTLDSGKYPNYLKVIIISALILENLSYFNADTYEILLNEGEASEILPIKSRALTGIVLIALLHPERIIGNLSIKSRLLISAEENDFTKNVNDIINSVVKTYDTNRIDNKMRNEVIPGLMKINPEIIDKMKNIASDSEDFLSDANPQWEELIENSEVGEKIREINDMQLEGADVMVTAFSNLKGFPFFNLISNWFMPFVPGHYEFAKLQPDQVSAMDNFTSVMCDSDLNSFLLSLGSMPEDKRNLMLTNMQNQMREAQEAMNNGLEVSYQQQIARNIKHTLQDLYRFFKFYRKKDDFKDPFATPIEYSNIEPLIKILGITQENILIISEFYLKNKYYREAAGFYEMLDRLNPSQFNIWEKIGYCHDRLREFSKAAEWYKKADIVNPGNPWLEKKLAISLKNSGNTEEALEYYEKALKNEPENYHLIMSAAQCLLASNKFKEAINHFYHAEYLQPDKKDPKRAIAWAYLLSGDYDNAISRYEEILTNEDADKQDYLNAAHCYLANNNFKSALKNYKSFLDKSEKREIVSLVLAFKEDSELLKKIGVKTSDLRLIVDKIRYDLIS